MKTLLILVSLLSATGFVGCSPKSSGSDVNKKNQDNLTGQDPAQILLNNVTVIKSGVSAFSLKSDGTISDAATMRSKGGTEGNDFCTLKDTNGVVNIVGSEIREKDSHYVVTLRSVFVKNKDGAGGGSQAIGGEGSFEDAGQPASGELFSLDLDEDWATRNFRCIEAKNCAKSHGQTAVVDCNAFASTPTMEPPSSIKSYYGKECTATAIPEVSEPVPPQNTTQTQPSVNQGSTNSNQTTNQPATVEVCTSLKGKKVFISKGVVSKILNAKVKSNLALIDKVKAFPATSRRQTTDSSCGLSSAATARSIITGKLLRDYDMPTYGGQLSLFAALPGWSDPDFSSSYWPNIEKSINAGYPVVIGLNGLPFSSTGRGHIVLIVGIEGDTVFYHDPNGNAAGNGASPSGLDVNVFKASKSLFNSQHGHPQGKFLFVHPSQFSGGRWTN